MGRRFVCDFVAIVITLVAAVGIKFAEGTTIPSFPKNLTEIIDIRGPCDGSKELIENHPNLCRWLDFVEKDIDGAVSKMDAFAKEKKLLIGNDLQLFEGESKVRKRNRVSEKGLRQLPVVFAHGMGDSCFNDGMVKIGKHTSSLLDNAYVTCIPTGASKAEDTKNGYFLNMDSSVDVFASKISQDPELQEGFHAIGFSQGNNVIRGYIARYNTPTVHTFISINGVNAGEGAVPGCFPNDDNNKATALGGICDLLLEQASRRAYTEFAQEHSFQANYWRDPRKKERDLYLKYSQLAKWNNEVPEKNQTYNDNFGKTKIFVWVMATKDSMVWPKEGEHWGCPDSADPFHKIIPMKETEWYKHNFFGLRKADEEGKNIFETFEGDHLQFTDRKSVV